MRTSRVVLGCWVAGMVVGCSTGDNAGFEGGEDAPYEAAAHDSGATGDAAVHDAAVEAGVDGAAGDAAGDSANEGGGEAGDDATMGDAGDGGDAGDADGGDDADAGADADAEADADADASMDAGVDADAEVDATADALADADGATLVPPICDGVISPGEYGGAGNQNTSGSQTWYVTWDDNNLYVAIDNANVAEGNVVYVAADPGADGGAASLASGYAYDNTDVTTLPVGATLVVYAKQSYDEARVATASDAGAVWGAAQVGAVQVCANASPTVREEVIPWSLAGGRPAAYGWLGYVAADPNQNPQGYIYGQEPADDPGGGPANNETYTKSFAVPDATPGVDTPFADEQ
jgi:hypothetical protein